MLDFDPISDFVPAPRASRVSLLEGVDLIEGIRPQVQSVVTSVLETPETPVAQVVEVAPVISEVVRVVGNKGVGYAGKEPSAWNWTDLRDYIVSETEARHGAQVRDPLKESGICKSFISRWGIETAVAIARVAFETYGGMWKNAPITINRFSKGSDPFFAQVIAKNL